MTTALDKILKRALRIKGKDYVLALSPDGIKLTLKGRKIGVELNEPTTEGRRSLESRFDDAS